MLTLSMFIQANPVPNPAISDTDCSREGPLSPIVTGTDTGGGNGDAYVTTSELKKGRKAPTREQQALLDIVERTKGWQTNVKEARTQLEVLRVSMEKGGKVPETPADPKTKYLFRAAKTTGHDWLARTGKKPRLCSLVVVSASLLGQWMSEQKDMLLLSAEYLVIRDKLVSCLPPKRFMFDFIDMKVPTDRKNIKSLLPEHTTPLMLKTRMAAITKLMDDWKATASSFARMAYTHKMVDTDRDETEAFPAPDAPMSPAVYHFQLKQSRVRALARFLLRGKRALRVIPHTNHTLQAIRQLQIRNIELDVRRHTKRKDFDITGIEEIKIYADFLSFDPYIRQRPKDYNEADYENTTVADILELGNHEFYPVESSSGDEGPAEPRKSKRVRAVTAPTSKATKGTKKSTGKQYKSKEFISSSDPEDEDEDDAPSRSRDADKTKRAAAASTSKATKGAKTSAKSKKVASSPDPDDDEDDSSSDSSDSAASRLTPAKVDKKLVKKRVKPKTVISSTGSNDDTDPSASGPEDIEMLPQDATRDPSTPVPSPPTSPPKTLIPPLSDDGADILPEATSLAPNDNLHTGDQPDIGHFNSQLTSLPPSTFNPTQPTSPTQADDPDVNKNVVYLTEHLDNMDFRTCKSSKCFTITYIFSKRLMTIQPSKS